MALGIIFINIILLVLFAEVAVSLFEVFVNALEELYEAGALLPILCVVACIIAMALGADSGLFTGLIIGWVIIGCIQIIRNWNEV